MNALKLKKVLSTLKDKKTRLFIAWFLIFLVFTIYSINNYLKIENLKADLIKNTISAEEKKLIEYKNRVSEVQEKIRIWNEKKKELEIEILKNMEFEDCFKKQIERVINWQESLLEFCENKIENKSFSWSQANLIPEVGNMVKGGDKVSPSFDLNKLAYAVAMQETKNCSKWTWLNYNNCFWIKNGSIAPCERKSNSGFCIYNNSEESYKAFKKIWSTAYVELPTLAMAERWTWKDRAKIWKANVLYFYNS